MTWEEKISKGVLAMADANYGGAESSFKAALDEARGNFGDNDERVVQTLTFLGQAYYKVGRYGQAEECLNQTLATGNGDIHKAVAHLSLAQMTGESTAASSHFQQAVSVLQNRKKEKVSCAIEASDSLGRILRDMSARDSEGVQKNFRSLLTQAQRHYQTKPTSDDFFGPAPEQKLDEWEKLMESGLSMLSKETSAHWVRAYEEITQALRIAYKLFQPNHPKIADNLMALAEAAIKLGFSDEACSYLAHALKISDEQDPPDRHKSALIKLSIAGLHTEVYDYNAAMRYLAEAVELLAESGLLHNSDNSAISASFVTLMQQAQLFSSAHELVSQAIELEETDRLEQANYLYDNSLILLEQVFSEESLEIAQILRFKAVVLKKLHRNKEARTTEARANQIEDEITEKYRALERFRQSLPPVVLDLPGAR